MTEVRDSYFMFSIYRSNCLVTIPTRTLLDIEDVLDLTLPYWQTILPIHRYMWIWYPRRWYMRWDRLFGLFGAIISRFSHWWVWLMYWWPYWYWLLDVEVI